MNECIQHLYNCLEELKKHNIFLSSTYNQKRINTDSYCITGDVDSNLKPYMVVRHVGLGLPYGENIFSINNHINDKEIKNILEIYSLNIPLYEEYDEYFNDSLVKDLSKFSFDEHVMFTELFNKVQTLFKTIG